MGQCVRHLLAQLSCTAQLRRQPAAVSLRQPTRSPRSEGQPAASSSSLVALDAGLANLRLHRCKAALVGAVQLQLESGSWVAMGALNALAPDGQCKTFDSKADGYGRSEA